MAVEVAKKYLLGDFEVDPANHLLTCGQTPVALSRKRFQVLLYLLEHSGRLVTREELLERFWNGSEVYEDNLTKCVSEIRKALDDQRRPYRLIETVPGVGYRYIGPLEEALQPAGTSFEIERTRGVKIVVDEEDEHNADLDNQPKLQEKSPVLVTGDVRRVARATNPLLRPVVIAAAIVAVGVGAFMIYRARTRPTAISPAPIRSIAVLPLKNLSGDSAQDYFADGMTESLINNLGRIRALRVISRTSSMRYKGSNKSLPEIAQELNVDAVIEGSVQKSGERVRVTAQLIHAETDTHLWAREYERDLTDAFKLEGEVARAVVDEIRIQITPEERARMASVRTVNPQAYEAYLLGRFHANKANEQGWKQAIEYFERATQLTPDYAVAYAGLSDAWLLRGVFGANPKGVESPSRAAAMKAIELDEQLAEPHISLGNIKHFYDWDWAGAEQEFKRSLELDPGSLDAHTYYGTLLMHLGRHNEAIREGQIAVELDPMSSKTQSSFGRFLYRARRYEEALPHLQLAVELEPRAIHSNFRLGDVYTKLGRYDEAIAAFERIREVQPQGGDFQAGLARVYALKGRKQEARQMIIGLKANPAVIAGVYAALGDKDEAFRILAKAVDEHQFMVALKEEPAYESLHSDPRWKVLLRRMNFPSE